MHRSELGRTTLCGLNDAQLITLCIADNPPAWDALIERYAPLIYTVARQAGASSQDIEDVFQDVCILLYDHLVDLRNTLRLSSWLITVTRRTVWRTRKRKTVPTFTETLEDEWRLEAAITVGIEAPLTPEESILETELRWELHQAIGQLSPNCRNLIEVLYLRDENASYADVSKELGIAVNSVGPIRSRCLEHLRKKLNEKQS